MLNFSPKRKVRAKSVRVKLLKNVRRFSFWQSLAFVAVFGLIGGYIIYRSFAADLTTDSFPNRQASTGQVNACWGVNSSTEDCDRAAIKDIDAARKAEGKGPIEPQLPSDYASLTRVQKLVAVTNAERTARSLPALAGPVATLDSRAQAGATSGSDPTGPAGYGWASNWAAVSGDALSVDFAWMYSDGLGGINLDCTSKHRSGCQIHRHNILRNWKGAMGAGDNKHSSVTILLVENYKSSASLPASPKGYYP
jgi:cytoskeletal protein RodZ